MYDSSFYFAIILVGWCFENNYICVESSPSKFVPKTPYELMYGKSLSVRHFHVYGYKAKIRPYNPHTKKHDAKIINGYFICSNCLER